MLTGKRGTKMGNATFGKSVAFTLDGIAGRVYENGMVVFGTFTFDSSKAKMSPELADKVAKAQAEL